ncbi:hypothetical protein BU14_0161s0009 [Porphyra umbilicalis]|uniref:Uncharacterized protein n=1 Tax=Porphyra umbilicalis TaxID=2786 RepID=A0A1X6P8E9_PORUM|nr:hypothetical protein BU14_0161s0009 [Porphyra umbilicalis]|eukprot:OSX77087.1 hypothetical protein BU14_0161s0009 [Porphyra umbilicalis]
MKLSAAVAAACVASAAWATTTTAHQLPTPHGPVMTARVVLVEDKVFAKRGEAECELAAIDPEVPQPPLPATAKLANEEDLLMASAVIGSVASCELGEAPETPLAAGASATIKVEEGVIMASYGAEMSCELGVVEGEPAPMQHRYARVMVEEGMLMAKAVIVDRFSCELGEADPALNGPPVYVPPPAMPPMQPPSTGQPMPQPVPVPMPAPGVMPARVVLVEDKVFAKRGEAECELAAIDPEVPQPPLPATAKLANEEDLLMASAVIGSVASCELGEAPETPLAAGASATIKVEEGVIMASYGAEMSCELGVVEGEPAPMQHRYARVMVEEGMLMAKAVIVDRFSCELGEADPALNGPPVYVPPPAMPPMQPPSTGQPMPQPVPVPMPAPGVMPARVVLVEDKVFAKRGEAECELAAIDPEVPQPPLPATAKLANEEDLLMASAVIGSVASCELGEAPETPLAAGASATIKVEEGVIMASYGAEMSCELGVVEGEPAPMQHRYARVMVEEGMLMAKAVIVDRFSCELGEADPALNGPPVYVPPPAMPPMQPPSTGQPMPQPVPVPMPAPGVMPARVVLVEDKVFAKRGEAECELAAIDPEVPQPPLPATAKLANEEDLLMASAVIGSVASCELGEAPETPLAAGASATIKVEEGVIMASYGAEMSCELGVVEGEPAPMQHRYARVMVEEGMLMAKAVIVDRFSCELGEADPALNRPVYVPPPTMPVPQQPSPPLQPAPIPQQVPTPPPMQPQVPGGPAGPSPSQPLPVLAPFAPQPALPAVVA